MSWFYYFLLWFFIYGVMGALALAVLLFVQRIRAKKVLSDFYNGKKHLADLGYSEYIRVVKAASWLHKTDRDVEQEMYLYAYPRFLGGPLGQECNVPLSVVLGRHSLNPSGSAFVLADPPEPSPVEGDKWCDRCDNCQRCPSYRSGKFCAGASFVPLKDEREVKL